MQVQIFAILATILVAQQVQAGTLSFGGLMGDVSKVAVAGEKVIHQLENQVDVAVPETGYVEPATQNILSDMANALGDLANTITSLNVVKPKPQPMNIIGDVLGGVGDALGDLANALTRISLEMKVVPEPRSISSSGASIIGELGSVSAKTIASAAQAAAPYVKKLNAALGDLANTITGLSVENDYVEAETTNLIGDLMGGMGDALGDLANALTRLNAEVQVEPETRSVSSSGAAIIGEMGSISAKTIASAAQAAAPYIKKLNVDLGDLANALTHL